MNKKSLDGEKHQDECDKYFLGSVDNEMYLRKNIYTLNQFDDKRCDINNINSKPWE